jgi:hypothetical protein
MATRAEMGNVTYIICERQNVNQNKLSNLQDDILYQITGHNFKRGRESAINTMALTINEAKDITNLHLNIEKTEPVYTKLFPKVAEFDDINQLLTYQEEENNEDFQKQKTRSADNEQDKQISSETFNDFGPVKTEDQNQPIEDN